MKKMKIKELLKEAFALNEGNELLSDDELAILEKISNYIVQRRMAEPAIMVLETVRPLNFVGSQALAFLAPFATIVFKSEEYERFVLLLEKRGAIPALIDKLEQGLQQQRRQKVE